jgi:hypothetical protein
MLLKYLKSINLECHRFPDETTQLKALCMDDKNDSIRKILGLSNYNCCDYLYLRKQRIAFIELSDLSKQKEDLSKNKTEKELKKYIIEEIRFKALGSLVILFKMPTKFTIKHEKLHKKELILILVLCDKNKSSVHAFNHLSIDLQNALSPLIKSVKIIPFDFLSKEEIHNIIK